MATIQASMLLVALTSTERGAGHQSKAMELLTKVGLVQSNHTIRHTVATLLNELATSGYIHLQVVEPLLHTKLWMLNTLLLLVAGAVQNNMAVAVELVVI